MTIRRKLPVASLRSQRGLSLVELMVALTIGLFLVGAVGIIYVNTSNSSRSSTLESQMNEDAALALELLQQQIRLAGFSNVDASGNRLFRGIAIRGCDGGFAVGGTVNDNAGATAFSGLACNNVTTGSDSIAVRFEATLLNSQAAAGLPSNCVHEGITPWNASAEGAGSATPLGLADNRYYIATDANGIPSLSCRGRTGPAGYGVATALIPNIENLQIQYAVTRQPAADQPIPHQVAKYVSANHATLGATLNNWWSVAALRVCIVARSAQPVPTGDNSLADIGTYVDCAGAVQSPTDRFLRRAYVTTIQLRNMRTALPNEYQAGRNPYAYLYE